MFLGVDVGTFETKGVLVDIDGRVVSSSRRRHGISTPEPGQVEQDPEVVWWADVCEVASELIDSAPGARIDGVGVSAIGPCVVAVDEALAPLRPAILYGVDSRASEQVVALTERLGESTIFERTGNLLTSQSAGPKIEWLRQVEHEVWKHARWFTTSQSWIVAKLTGRMVIDHGTAGYFHPLYDLKAQRWDVSGCEDFIDEARLPRIAWAAEIAGRVTPDAAEATRIPVGTPVIVGTTDAPAEAVGSGVVDDGTLMAMYGSSGYFIRVGDEPIMSRNLWAAPFAFAGSYVLAAGTSTAGTSTRWIADLLGVTDPEDSVTFSTLLDLAGASEPGARGVLVLPHFAGERTPFQDPSSRGAVIGLGLQHTRADVARAVLEGVGHSVAEAILTYKSENIPISRVIAVGGATKNLYIVGTVSSITGLDQEMPGTRGACYGDAFLAALGVGAVPGPQAISSWLGPGPVVGPDAASVARLRTDHRDYLDLYRALERLNHRRSQ